MILVGKSREACIRRRLEEGLAAAETLPVTRATYEMGPGAPVSSWRHWPRRIARGGLRRAVRWLPALAWLLPGAARAVLAPLAATGLADGAVRSWQWRTHVLEARLRRAAG